MKRARIFSPEKDDKYLNYGRMNERTTALLYSFERSTLAISHIICRAKEFCSKSSEIRAVINFNYGSRNVVVWFKIGPNVHSRFKLG